MYLLVFHRDLDFKWLYPYIVVFQLFGTLFLFAFAIHCYRTEKIENSKPWSYITMELNKAENEAGIPNEKLHYPETNETTPILNHGKICRNSVQLERVEDKTTPSANWGDVTPWV